MHKALYIIGLWLLTTINLTAQETVKATTLQPATVKGVVIDSETGLPIPGANVYIKETMRGDVSNMEGEFHILQIQEGQTICISCIGCKDQYILFEGQEYIKAELIEDVVALGEVVTVGYGVQERRDLTGAVSKITSEEISGIAPSFDNALVGKVAGVNVNLSSGAPGSATSITIRGLSSLNADSNPLFVIDGVPVYGTGKGVNNHDFGNGSVAGGTIGGNAVSNGYSQQPEFERNPLAALNPDDIESIEILKDAFSTAIYGSRGAAGVILVTTKKGKKGKPQINIGHSVEISQPMGTPDLLNANEFSDIYTRFNRSQGDSDVFPTTHNTDWLDQVIQTGVVQETRASVSGGTDNTSYYISYNRYDQQGYIINQDFLRNSIRTNFDFSPAEWINFGTNSSFAIVDNAALNSQSVYRDAIMMSPNLPIYNSDGSYFFHTPRGSNFENNINTISGHLGNPVATANEDNNVKDTRVISNFYAELKPLPWMRFKSEIGLDIYNTKSYNRNIATPQNPGGTGTSSSNQNLKYVVNNVLTLRKHTDDHLLNAIIGQSFETSEESRMRVTGTGFFDDNEKSIQSATDKRVLDAITQEWAVVSYFTRLNYRYKNRYLAGFTYRIDGSSRFSKNERYRGFPSLSAGWILTEERFMDNSQSWLNEFKIRTSYGLTGLDGSFGGYYGNQGQWTRDNRTVNGGTLMYNGVPLLFNSQSVNPNLEWETTTSFDLGFDASLFNGKLDITFDYFYKRTNNLLANDLVPLYMGWSSQQQNVGDMKNEGLELLVNGTIYQNRDWLWTGSFNISRIKDKLLRLNEAGYQMAESQGLERKVFVVGESLNQFYMYDWVGVDPLTGNPMWRYDDGSISDVPPQAVFDEDNPLANRVSSGSSMPDFYGGFSNNIRYKNWELNFAFSYSVGQKLYNGTQATLMTYTLTDANNLSSDMLDYWKIPGHQTDVPKLDNATTVYRNPQWPGSGLNGYDVSRLNNRFLEDASYLRLRNITLGYSFKNDWVRKLYMERIRVYVQGSNLLTFTGYTGIDPEVSAYGSSAILSGYDEITMPQAKSVKFGIDISF
ncbi:TonB-dependent receptor [Carboxylicivirga sp. M1479]|uniref:SusC/RagA family TonB-linked outer membrane protein n=1 Tax=Carboxylicivirga sp. M1479 TaxID=2594476 RepID=UPI00117853A6|nr:TonB-dependent receptor [Carboxylicivirga sp. M1479]TRX71842.1 TonB-dependent receptor [Carboxylicivirga sp. M1479]